jgi:hypothetical protein
MCSPGGALGAAKGATMKAAAKCSCMGVFVVALLFPVSAYAGGTCYSHGLQGSAGNGYTFYASMWNNNLWGEEYVVTRVSYSWSDQFKRNGGSDDILLGEEYFNGAVIQGDHKTATYYGFQIPPYIGTVSGSYRVYWVNYVDNRRVSSGSTGWIPFSRWTGSE